KTHALRPESDRWRPPKQGFFKINSDAAFNVKENKTYSGIIVRNFKGNILASKTMVHDNIPSGFAAEATACLQAVTVGRDLGMKSVKIEGDSLTFQHARRIANESAHCLASEGLKIGKNEYLVYGTAGQDITEVYTENKFQ
ncbi:hypothetical protein Golob_006921, partial [Gossypium lobatum]|nr:hypothetical protein [Gossypium lobatum]